MKKSRVELDSRGKCRRNESSDNYIVFEKTPEKTEKDKPVLPEILRKKLPNFRKPHLSSFENPKYLHQSYFKRLKFLHQSKKGLSQNQFQTGLISFLAIF